jgi:hypothetical protein
MFGVCVCVRAYVCVWCVYVCGVCVLAYVWGVCVCVRARARVCALSGAIAPYSTEQ